MDPEREDRWRVFMTAAQDGDGAAYEKLLVDVIPVLRVWIRSRVWDRDAVEDVVQNVLLSIHRARHTYRPERPFTPWLRTVMRNAVIDHLRVRRRQREREESLPEQEPAAPPEELPILRDSLSPRISRALSALPPAQRQAVELLQVQGLSVAEAAVRAGVSPGALKVRAHRGYRAMRSQLLE
ncbi:MAG: sigma-70 family RNA polymerase sigma factor, partial [Myxococcota bacterium]